ncbi:MAG: phage tail protein [Jatrophihabitans sp.]
MRGTVAGLATPHPLWDYLPSILQDDGFATGLVAGLDEVLAPAVAVLDCLDAYLDPQLAPADFARWVGSWSGLDWEDGWPLAQLRVAIAAMADCHAERGTVRGLTRLLELLTGGVVEIVETGGVGWSRTPDGELPGEEVPRVALRVTVPAAGWFLNQRALDEIVAAEKPAHVQHQVELVVIAAGD